jgi:hypothetical protein
VPAISAKSGLLLVGFWVPYHYYRIFLALESFGTPVGRAFRLIQQHATQLLRFAPKKCAVSRLASRDSSGTWFCCFSRLCVGPNCLRRDIRHQSSTATPREFPADSCAYWHWYGHQQSRGHQLSDNMHGQLYIWNFGYAHRYSWLGISIFGIQWRVHRDVVSDHARQ